MLIENMHIIAACRTRIVAEEKMSQKILLLKINDKCELCMQQSLKPSSYKSCNIYILTNLSKHDDEH